MANTLTYPASKIWKVRAVEILSAVLLFPLRLKYRVRRGGRADTAIKILFVEPFGFGDVVSLSAAFDPILAKFPVAEIHVLTHPRNRDVFADDARVYKTHVAPIPWAGHYHEKRLSFEAICETTRVAKALRKVRIDFGVDPRGDFRSQLLLLLCGCRVRTGFRNYLVNSNIRIRGLLLNRDYGEMGNHHRFEINRRLAEFALGVKLPELSLPCFRSSRSEGEPSRKIVVHPFGGWEGKLWPTERWVELLSALTGYEIVLCGTRAEERALKELSAAVGGEYRMTSVGELVNLLNAARLFIGLDSGPMNLASAMGVPVVALFGPGDSDRWRPLSDRSVFLHHQFECNPCPQKECVRRDDSCMNRLTVEHVKESILEILGNG